MTPLLSLLFVISLSLGTFCHSYSKIAPLQGGSLSFQKHSASAVQELKSQSAAFTPGNLVLTQPNEIESKHFLVQFTPEGQFVANYDLSGKVQPIDIRFLDDNSFIVLDFRFGLFRGSLKDPNGVQAFGYNESITDNHSLFGLEIVKDNIFVLDEHSNFPEAPRIPAIHMWSLSSGLYQRVWTKEVEHPAMMRWYNNRMYVSELNKIAVLDENGHRLTEFTPVQVPSDKWHLITGIRFLEDEMYVGVEGTSQQKDAVFVLDPATGKIRRIIEMQGKFGGGLPNSFAFRKSGDQWQLYVDNSESWEVETERIQVYDAKTGKFLHSFGGVECSDLLCQTFNGFEFVLSGQ